MTKLKKTSRTKVSDEALNAGSGQTIHQPDINNNKVTTISDIREQTHGERTVQVDDEQRIRKAFVDKDWNEIKIADS